MSTIDPRYNGLNSPQLNGILTSVPMPTATLSPNANTVVGALHGGFSVNTNFPSFGMGTVGGGLVGAVGTPTATPGGQVVVGSGGGTAATGASATNGAGTTPAAGAQPPAPTGAQPGTAATPAAPAATPATPATPAAPATAATPAATTTTPATTAAGGTGSPLAEAISGFGKASRGEPIKASVDGASFGFPSFRASAKSVDPPAISWGPGWKKVEKGGMWFMQHPNGVRAVPAVEWRITPRPADKVQTIEVTNGWGKRFPNGSVLVFDRVEGAYLLDPKGNKKKMSKGNHVIDGVKVRIFEASVVRTIDKDGKVDVFDSRGNVSTGTTRWNDAAPAAANAGAAMAGGAAKPDAGPTTGGGPAKAAGTETTTPAGPGVGKFSAQDIQEMTAITREIIGEIRSGNVDPARLQELQARLEQLPAGLLQAAGAAGTMTTSGTTVAAPATTDVAGERGDDVPPAPGTTDGGTGDNAGGGTTEVVTPTPGRDANATRKELAAGTSVKVDAAAIPAELHGMQARFAQLPASVQEAVARAFGSDQGAGAFKPDRLVAFGSDGTVRVVDKGVVFLRHQVQVRGAGPGEDQVLTMKPGRQPGSSGVSGGGASTAQAAQAARPSGGTTTTPVAGGGGPAAADAPTPAAAGAATTSPKSIELFAAGGELRHEDLGGLNGTYTWKSLPQAARTVILDLLRSGSDDPAAKAFASRTGSGWAIDPNGIIVIDAGFASFPSGLSMTRGGVPGPTPAVGVPTPAGGGSAPTGQPIGHDATRPPVSGGGGVGSVAPSTPPPIPDIADPGEGGQVAGGGAGASHDHDHGDHHH